MSVFAEDIEREAGDEPIDAVVIGYLDWGDDERNGPGNARRGEVLTWAEARSLLAYEYDDGFGGADCHPITAWTATRVLVVGQYDGSTWVTSVPRNPVPHEPDHIGGG